jgi:hypothetical protein
MNVEPSGDIPCSALPQWAATIDAFTGAFDANTCRQLLWNMTKAFMGSEEADGLTGHERSRYLFFYEQMCQVVGAIFQLQQGEPAPVVAFNSPIPAA